MDLETIHRNWKPRSGSRESLTAWWDAMADRFSEHEIPTAETSLALRIIESNQLVQPGDRVLDVGCGTGGYAAALAERGATVTGIDLSPNMIRHAEQNVPAASVAFQVEDWEELNLEKQNWDQAFDLVLANMTPAVGSADSFMKLSVASRGWCLMVKPSRRTNRVYDRLNEQVGAPPDTESLDDTVAYAFDLLWHHGHRPLLAYEDQVWENRIPLEQAISQYTHRIAAFHSLGDTGKDRIRHTLADLAQDGTVEERTETTLVAMYWHI